MTRQPIALTIAGSDSSGGAGIQADLKTFSAFGLYGMSAITAVTAQNPATVRRVFELPHEVVGDQVETVLENPGADVVKVGMLGSTQLVDAVCRALESYPHLPLVLDPVMVSTSGHRLLPEESVSHLKERLFPRALVVTPNIPETELLCGRSLGGASTPEWLQDLPDQWGCDVLVKGGHAASDKTAHATVVDLLITARGIERFEHPRVQTHSSHGTGCTLSSAIAAYLALGKDLSEAVRGAIDYVERTLLGAVNIGLGGVDHFAGRQPSELEGWKRADRPKGSRE